MKTKLVTSVVLMSLPAVVLTACNMGATGRLGQLQRLADSCPKHKTVSAYVGLSASGNQRGEQLTAGRMTAVENAAQKVAVCGGGELKVVAFGASEASTVTVFDDRLDPPGATQVARLLRTRGLVNRTIHTIQRSLSVAFRRLSPSGADPVGQLFEARDFIEQGGPNTQTDILIETAGLNRDVYRSDLTSKSALELAARPTVPSLREAWVTFAGLGRVGVGGPPPTSVVQGLVSFYRALCQRTHAVACFSTSDIAVGS